MFWDEIGASLCAIVAIFAVIGLLYTYRSQPRTKITDFVRSRDTIDD